MKKRILLVTAAVLTLTASTYTAAEVRLPAVIGDNMVLQQGCEVPIWGWADPGEKVSVKADWRWFGSSTTADEHGNWKLEISTPKKPGPHTITIKGDNTITIENVLLGEVWLCSGQSNMQMAVHSCNNAEAEIAAADYPRIRLFHVARKTALEPQTDCTGSWRPCSPDTVRGFSAAAYYFGRKLHKQLDVPVGLIHSSWGGTPAEAWTRKEVLDADPDLAPLLDRLPAGDLEERRQNYEKQQAKWREKFEEADPGLSAGWQKNDFDDSTWNTMELPCLWSTTDLAEFDGIVWYRKTIDLPESWAGKKLTLELGPIDDMDLTLFNGETIGRVHTAGKWQQFRKYTVPAGLAKAGANLIAVRVYDNDGDGGVYGSADQLKVYPQDKPAGAISLAGNWKYKVAVKQQDLPAGPPTPPDAGTARNPTVLYNGMIAPLIPYAIRGAIWYQGESNVGRAKQYQKLFPAMIQNWRDDWGRGEFPFYFVQIAPYKYGRNRPGSAFLREAQLLTMKTVPNTGMVVITDISNINDIHPKNKQDVGRRLALWALAKTYDKKNFVYSGPIYKNMEVENGKIRIFFDYVDGGLVAKGGDLTCFAIAGEDNVFHPATAVIEGDTVVVGSDDVPEPVAVRFGFTDTAEPNLFNAAGLPASPFRTDLPQDRQNNK